MTDVKFGKRVFTLAVVAMTILWTMAAGLAPLMTNAQVSLSAGDLIKGESFSTVYYYGSDGMRYTFPNEKTYFTWYSNFNGVTTVSDSQLAGVTLGGNAVYRPGTNWIKIQSDDNVYAVSPSGALHWIESEAVATALYGSSAWGGFVHDVPDTFFADYSDSVSLMSADGLYDGALVSDGSTTYLFWGGDLREVSSAGMSGNRLQSKHVLNTSVDLSGLPMGAALSGYSAEVSDTAQMTSGDVVAPSGSLSYSVASSTPAGITIPGGANGVEMTKWAFTAGSAAAELDSLLVSLGGIGATTDFSNVYLYEGTVRLTEGRSVNSATRTATFSNLNLSIAAGATRYISLVATTSTASPAGDTASFGIAESANVGSGGTVSGGSAYGNVFTFSASDVGTIEIDKNGTITDPSIGAADAVVGQFNITASTEDASLRRMRLDIDNASDHSDFKLWQGTTLLATGVNTTGDSVDFELTSPYVIAEGSNRVFKVSLDVGGQAADTIKVSVKNTTDVIAVGGDFGFNMVVDYNTTTGTGSYDGSTCTSTAGLCSFSTIQGGDVTIVFNGPTTADISIDSEDLTFLAFSITAAQDITVKDFDIIVSADDDGDSIVEFETETAATNDTDGLLNTALDEAFLTDVSIRMADSGSRLMGPLELSVAGSDAFQILDFTDDFFMAGGTTYDLIVTADVSANTLAGELYAVAIDISGVVIEDENNDALTNATDIVPTGNINGNAFTAASPSLAVALASSPTSFTTVQGSSSESVLGMTLTAGSAEDVTITSFLVDAWGDATAAMTDAVLGGEANAQVEDFFSSCSLYDGAGVLVGGPVGTTTGGNGFNFESMNFVVPAGEVVLANVVCNLHNPSQTANAYFGFEVELAANVAAQDLSGDNVALTGFDFNAVTTSVAPTVMVTVDDSGTLAIAGDSSSPDAAILLAGTSNNVVSTFRATATLEDFLITTLTFDEVQAGLDGQAAGAYANNIGGVTLSYTDSAGLPASKTAYMASNRVTLSGLDMYVDTDSVTKFNVAVNIPVIDRTSGGSASSGEKIKLGFSDGDDSGSDQLRAVAQGSGSVVGEATTGNDIGDNTTNINAFVVRETMPTVNLHASSPSGAKVPGLQEVLRFTVAASSNEDVIVDELVFKMSSTDNAGTPTLWNECDSVPAVNESVLADFTLYNTSDTSTPLESGDSAWDLLGVLGGTCSSTPEKIGFVQVEGLQGNMVIAAGTTETFSLYFDSTGASSSADDTIRFDIPADPILSTWIDTDTVDVATVTPTAIINTLTTNASAGEVGRGTVICITTNADCDDAADETAFVADQDATTATIAYVYRGYLGDASAVHVIADNLLYLPSSFVWFDSGTGTATEDTAFNDAISGAYLVDNLPLTGGTIVF